MFKKSMNIADYDPVLWQAIQDENRRQEEHIELIASENYASPRVMEAQGSQFTNKYAEGYPGKRYYGGCEYADIVEQLAIDRAKELFGADYVNVQPHSGSQANAAVYGALINAGDTILGMDLAHGGHLTHGAKVSFSGKIYNSVLYGITADGLIDYEDVRQKALEHKPKMIVAGFSAYSQVVDWKKMREIADEVGAYLMIDMAHIAGLVATGAHPSPVPYADVVTSTSHKTLRGPRGGFILTNNEEIAKKIDKAVFPGSQGGPLMHIIAAKAVAFGEALQPEFKTYIDNVVENSTAMGEGMVDGGLRLVSGGTDNHLCLVDLTPADITGKDAEKVLESVGLTVNKNTIPNETRSPFVTSGIRVGSAAATTRGFTKDEFTRIGQLIAASVYSASDEARLQEIAGEVSEMLAKLPLYPNFQ